MPASPDDAMCFQWTWALAAMASCRRAHQCADGLPTIPVLLLPPLLAVQREPQQQVSGQLSLQRSETVLTRPLAQL